MEIEQQKGTDRPVDNCTARGQLQRNHCQRACLILSSSGLQVHPLFLDLRGEVSILAPLSGQRPRPVAQGVLDHFEDVAELFQALLGGLPLLTLVLHRALEVFYRGLNLGVVLGLGLGLVLGVVRLLLRVRVFVRRCGYHMYCKDMHVVLARRQRVPVSLGSIVASTSAPLRDCMVCTLPRTKKRVSDRVVSPSNTQISTPQRTLSFFLPCRYSSTCILTLPSVRHK